MSETLSKVMGNKEQEMEIFKKLTLLYEREKKEGSDEARIFSELTTELETFVGKPDQGDPAKAKEDSAAVFKYLIAQYEQKKKQRGVNFDDIYGHLRTEILALFPALA